MVDRYQSLRGLTDPLISVTFFQYFIHVFRDMGHDVKKCLIFETKDKNVYLSEENHASLISHIRFAHEYVLHWEQYAKFTDVVQFIACKTAQK